MMISEEQIVERKVFDSLPYKERERQCRNSAGETGIAEGRAGLSGLGEVAYVGLIVSGTWALRWWV